MTKKRKKGRIAPISHPVRDSHMAQGEQGSTDIPNADSPSPPAPDMSSPVFIQHTPSFIGGVFKSLCFCVPTAIVLIAISMWYFQNITVQFIPEFKTVLQTLHLVRPNADFKEIKNTPTAPVIATITQVTVDPTPYVNTDKTGTVFGVVYNTTPQTLSQITIRLDFMTHNNTIINSQTHTIHRDFKPNQHTEFTVKLQNISMYADTIQLQYIK